MRSSLAERLNEPCVYAHAIVRMVIRMPHFLFGMPTIWQLGG